MMDGKTTQTMNGIEDELLFDEQAQQYCGDCGDELNNELEKLDRDLVKLGFAQEHDSEGYDDQHRKTWLEKPFPYSYHLWIDGVVKEINPRFYVDSEDNVSYIEDRMRDQPTLFEQEENLNQPLTMGDRIRVVDVDKESEYELVYPSGEPTNVHRGMLHGEDTFPRPMRLYAVMSKSLYRTNDREYQNPYWLLWPVDDDGKVQNIKDFHEIIMTDKDRWMTVKKHHSNIPGDIEAKHKEYVDSGRDIISRRLYEQKESKLNPELMIGDEIMVVSTEGIHDFGAPELYKPYVVVGIKHGTTINRELHNWTHGEEDEEQTPDRLDSPEVPRSRLGFRKEFDTIPYTYYQIEPIGETDKERLGHMLAGGGRRKPMYIFPTPSETHRGNDQWILRPGFLRGETWVPKPEAFNEHEEKLNPPINVGDRIVLVDVKEGGGFSMRQDLRPELFTHYVVGDKIKIENEKWPFEYRLVETEDYDNLDEKLWKYRNSPKPPKIFYPWLYKWISADKKTINEHGADTSWSQDDDTITLQDILELTKDIEIIDFPTKELVPAVLGWEDNPEEIERISQVEVSSQYPILIMVDEQDEIQWILDGNHRAHQALMNDTETIPAKLIKPSDLDERALKMFYPEGIPDQQNKQLNEQTEPGLNPELEIDDTILIIDIDREREHGKTMYTTPNLEMRPETYVPYTVVGKRSAGHKSKWPFKYTLVPEGEIEITGRNPYGEEHTNVKLLYPWIYQWIYGDTPTATNVDRKTISEHKETKLNPELEVDDIIRVIYVDGEHDKMPKRFGVYKVISKSGSYGENIEYSDQYSGHYGVGTKDGIWYEILPHPWKDLPDTDYIDHLVSTYGDPRAKRLYRGDTWIYDDVDRKTLSEHKETKVSPDLEEGDVIRVIDVKDEGRPNKPERFGVYKVVSKGVPPIVLEKESVAPWYGIISTDDDDFEQYMVNDPVIKRIYWGDTWIYADVNRKTLNEHKETKISPELMIGDEILVLHIGSPPVNTPELYRPYVVRDIKQSNNTQEIYYGLDLLDPPDLETAIAQQIRLKDLHLHQEDTWMLRPGFLRGGHEEELDEEDGIIDDMVYRDEPMDKHTRRMSRDLGSLEGFPIEGFKNIPPPPNESVETEEEIEYLEEIPVDKNLVHSADEIGKHFSNFLTSKGLEFPKQEIKEVMRGVKAIILKLKYHYNRPRPWQIAQAKRIRIKFRDFTI